MAIYREHKTTAELNASTVQRSFLRRIIGEGDNTADRFSVQVLRNGEPEDLSGCSCFGYFIRPDGVTLILSGAVDGSVAYVDLPQAAYAKVGSFTLTVKINSATTTNTVWMVDGIIADTITASISDPASLIPSVAELEELVAEAEEAVDKINALSVAAVQISGTRYKISVTKSS